MESNSSLTYPVQASAIKCGDHLMIKTSPCKCIDVTTSKTGKHGGCKCHFIGVDIFTGSKHMMIRSSTKPVDVPFVKKEEYELVNVEEHDDYVSLMSVKSGDMHEDVKIEDQELKAKILAQFEKGQVVICSVLSAMGRSVVIDFKVQKQQ